MRGQPACGMGYPVVTRQLLGVDAGRQLPVGEKRDLRNLDSSRSSRRETFVRTREKWRNWIRENFPKMVWGSIDHTSAIPELVATD